MEHPFLEMRSLIKTSLRFIMKFPGEERSLIKTYLRSLIKTDFMEQPSAAVKYLTCDALLAYVTRAHGHLRDRARF